MPLIELKKVSIFLDNKRICENLNFSVEKGDYVCVLGSNGSGKSTLLKGILGLTPVDGEIIFDGVTAREIGYLPQTTHVQKDFPASAEEVVMSGLLSSMGSRPFYGKKEKQRAESAMKKLEVFEFRKQSFCSLSGGQRQRVLICRALLSAEKVILLDEPVAALDPVVTGEMYTLLRRLNREEGLTVIMVSHDVNVARLGANKILHLRGSQLFFGPSDEYLDTDLAKYYLGGCCHR